MQNLLFALVLSFGSAHAATDLKTVSEKSGWIKTGRMSEVLQLCGAFQKKYPAQVRCERYGKTPEGRPLVSLVVSRSGNLTPGQAHSKKTPVLFVQAGIHAGEIDGKDSTFWLIRELLEKKLSGDPLASSTLVFVPVVNVDGHERVGPHNRPNQIGPEEMGWRTTAQNLNLNRDFAKVDAPEMQALIQYWNQWDPNLSLDLHVTDGAQFQHSVGIIVTPTQSGPEKLRTVAKEFEKDLVLKLKAKQHLALPFYPEFEKEDNPSSGIGLYVPGARLAHGYWWRRNRMGALIETHSWKDYKTRVQIHYDVVLAALELMKSNSKKWVEAEKVAFDESTKLSGKKVDLEFTRSDKFEMIDFLGYEYKISDSDVSGGKRIQYFPDKPQVWKMPLFNEVIPKLTIQAPQEGYFIPPAYQSVILPKLKTHAIEYHLYRGSPQLSGEIFRANTIEFSKKPYEGRQTLKLTGEWKKEERTLVEGTVFIPIHQRNGNLVMTLLEPLSSDSFLAWGMFNTAYEKKEYMEAYVAEDVAREMLKNKEIKAEFDQKLSSDPEFKKDPEARLEFFYKKHPSWDDRYGLYPVFRK